MPRHLLLFSSLHCDLDSPGLDLTVGLLLPTYGLVIVVLDLLQVITTSRPLSLNNTTTVLYDTIRSIPTIPNHNISNLYSSCQPTLSAYRRHLRILCQFSRASLLLRRSARISVRDCTEFLLVYTFSKASVSAAARHLDLPRARPPVSPLAACIPIATYRRHPLPRSLA